MNNLASNFLLKIFMKMWPGNQFQTFFNFQKIFCKKESDQACVPIWTNFESFADTYLI